MAKTNIVLGAGPAGLFCAHELKKNSNEICLIEKLSKVGGLAATHQLDSARYEIGPHIFQSSDEYILKIAKSYLGNEFIHIEWDVKQYLEGELLIFPNDLSNMWKTLGTVKMLKFIFSFLKHQVVRPNDFRSFIYRKVGKELAHFNVINYTEKMWGISMDDLEYEWIKPRMDRISIWKIIRSSFKRNKRDFYYPKFGAGQLYNIMAESQDVKLNEYPVKILHDKNTIQQIQTNLTTYESYNLFNSIPIVELITLLSPAPPLKVIEAAKKLRYRSQIYVILILDKPRLLDCQWIYFPEKEIPFARLHVPGAFSQKLAPQNKTILVFEYFCFTEDDIWVANDEELIIETFNQFVKMEISADCALVNGKVERKEKAYPLLDKRRKANLTIIQEYLESFVNLYTMGRHGLHTYDNQHEAARTGVNAAQKSIHPV